ncbi:IEC3 subunit of the Ino80 complex, chromatin re-modelling-domain-containing protein [Lophiotrema nucula]|uniref:IEC3 subunit of the Ino80 complex, chromatin re-modelling-domain-containing protein n=1 Tax=Lophiotrema nucula TaxID=690887 RepID=A0A6A5ZBP1_9PLEO|nr:IEC3 subunit of the Ino80 complex, chromatin re-modelling-domain-containing protein [Lophiotrema nucula]
MRAKFEDTMQTSNTLIKDEYRAVALARRLQEQNDQILEVLLDMNENARLPANRRFDLRSLAEIDAAVPSLDADADADADRERRIQDLRVDMVNGIITQEEYSRKVTQIRSTHSIAIARQLASLDERVPHSTDVPDPPPEGLILGEHAPGYMSPSHEEEYLAATDAALGDPTLYDPNAHDGRPLRITTSHPPPTEKDLTIRNPDSVYNWLRKNQPQVFLQDKEHHENLSEKSTARPANPSSRGGKRASAVSGNTPGPKGDHDDEETGFIPESGTGTGKGRRGNKEDDSAYRPKGGSSRPGKRKREDGDPVGKGGRKKNRASGGTSAG